MRHIAAALPILALWACGGGGGTSGPVGAPNIAGTWTGTVIVTSNNCPPNEVVLPGALVQPAGTTVNAPALMVQQSGTSLQAIWWVWDAMIGSTTTGGTFVISDVRFSGRTLTITGSLAGSRLTATGVVDAVYGPAGGDISYCTIRLSYDLTRA